MPGGALDTNLGMCDAKNLCETCHKNQEEYVGHFGTIKLVPLFHIGFFRSTIQLLQ